MPIHIVWFKKDLRVQDHIPLNTAAHAGPVLPLYIVEPSVVQANDFDRRHWDFIRSSLLSLRETLANLGMPLVVRTGEAVDVLNQIAEKFHIDAIYAHEETGNDITYQRDIDVRDWAKYKHIPLYETPNNGVIRRLNNRDLRSQLWKNRIVTPLVRPPEYLQAVDVQPGDIPTAEELSLHDEGITLIQSAGEVAARETLRSFLYERGFRYHSTISSPHPAQKYNSRLSPYITYGNLSLRQVYVSLQNRKQSLRDIPPEMFTSNDAQWLRALQNFESRLHWHDHFIQKLEDEPRIEYESFVSEFDAMRDHPDENSETRLKWAAFTGGQTGFPMIDASIRCLRETGWINFRMRAMLVSFASYDLWLDWRPVAVFMARLFTDYEPGIHYSQTQMQSGTTGINTVRIYNPIKQVIDHDPDGRFIRRWIPELEKVPVPYLANPVSIPPLIQLETNCRIGRQYPLPIVDHADAIREAKLRYGKVRNLETVQRAADQVRKRHGSRKSKQTENWSD